MSINVNGTNIDAVYFNNQYIHFVNYNGTQVYTWGDYISSITGTAGAAGLNDTTFYCNIIDSPDEIRIYDWGVKLKETIIKPPVGTFSYYFGTSPSKNSVVMVSIMGGKFSISNDKPWGTSSSRPFINAKDALGRWGGAITNNINPGSNYVDS